MTKIEVTKETDKLTLTVIFDSGKQPVVATIGRFECCGLEQIYIANCTDWYNSKFYDTLSAALREVINYLSTTYGVQIKL
jgi:hypothetical protein